MGYITRGKETLPIYNRKRLVVFSLSGLILAVAAIVLALIDPTATIARFATRISNGSRIHKLLQTELEGAMVETYLFNITNEERFLSGKDQKLKVQEVGPFTYMENRVNLDVELDETSGIIRYSPVTTVTFLPEKSIAHPKDVNVTMPNISLISMASRLSTYSKFTQFPFNLLVRRLKSKPTVNIDAHKYLWGYEEPLITLANTVLPGWINFGKLGVLDRLYDPNVMNRLEVGSTDADKFQIKTLNGIKGIKALKYDNPKTRTHCNTFVDAYEGLAYPPAMTPDSKVRIWRNVLCRMLELDFLETRLIHPGAEVLVYKISNRTYNYGPDKQCVCKEDVCSNGISDLSSCFFGLPLAISNAHFLGGEPKLFRRIEGLNPDEKKHGSEFLIEPTTGMAVGTSFTVQMNIVVEDTSFNSESEAFSNMILPIAYFKIVQPELNEIQLRDLRLIWVYGPKIFLAVEIVLFLIGISLIGYTTRRVLWHASVFGNTRAMDFTLNDSEKSQLQAKEVPLMK